MANPHPIPRFRKLKDTDSILARKILRRHPEQFLSATITGGRGAGKSQYAYRVLAKVFYELNGCSEEEAFKMALDHMIFSTDQFTDKIDKSIKTGEVIPALCLDDASVYFASYEFFTNMKKVIHLHAVFDLIRTSVTGMILTCPNRKMLLSFMRNYNDLRIKINRTDGHWGRAARAYIWRYMPDEVRKHIYIPFEEYYSCYMKQEYYEPYIKKRQDALVRMNEEMKAWRGKDKKEGE